jgi:hypothetical protein
MEIGSNGDEVIPSGLCTTARSSPIVLRLADGIVLDGKN